MKFITPRSVRGYLAPFLLITSLFFLWGFAHSILDVLNKFFQDTLLLTKTRSALVQAVVYGGYFLMALPAGAVLTRWGYKAGVMVGLGCYGLGALLFVPGAWLMNFEFFLFSLFVIGCGLTFLETSANPYVTVLGAPESAEQRINFSQSFNGIGQMLGPIVGGWLLLGKESQASNIALPYAAIGIVVLSIAIVFWRMRLPEIADETPTETSGDAPPHDGLWQNLRTLPTVFWWGWLAILLYVAAQTGINGFFINYTIESAHLDSSTAARLLGFGCMGLFIVGRVAGTWAMGRMSARWLLLCCGVVATIATGVAVLLPSHWGVGALGLVYLCESIMFPTIFALSLRGLTHQRKAASSLLIMGIVGGAIAPLIMGCIADHTTMAWGFVVPMLCFAYIAAYAGMLQRKTTAAQSGEEANQTHS